MVAVHGDVDPAFAPVVPNRVLTSGVSGDPRWPRLLDAVYGCLGAVPEDARVGVGV